jgi:hypothetical protein
MQPTSTAPGGIRTRQALVITFAPFAALLVVGLGRWQYFDPMSLEPPQGFLGIPYGLLVVAAAFAWGALGGLYVAKTRTLHALLLAVVIFTIPACILIIFGPAVILILQNLA